FTLLHNFTESSFLDESTFGVWDGSQFVFQESSWKIATFASVLWRYGLAPFYSRKAATEQKDKWQQIYSLLEQQKRSFPTVSSLLEALGLESIPKRTFKEVLRE